MANSLPHIKLRFDLTPEEIQARSQQIIEEYKRTVASVCAVPNPTFENTLVSLARAEAKFSVDNSVLDFPQYVSTDSAVRDASAASDKRVSEFLVELGMNEQLYGAVRRLADTKPDLQGEDARYLKFILRDFRRNGLELGSEQRAELMAIKKRISELTIDYQKNLNEDTTSIVVRKKDLKGLPDDFVKSLEEAKEQDSDIDDEKQVILTCKYPHVLPTLRQCTVEETRRRVEFMFSNQCKTTNVPIAEEVFTLRHKSAQILGYPTWAHYILEIRMAKNPASVNQFYDDLLPKLNAKGDEEVNVLLELKKDEQGAAFDGHLNAWDSGYYMTKLLRERYGVDEEHIKNFFPTETVIEKTFAIYQELLSLSFRPVPTAPTWHEEVRCYEATDLKSNELAGYFYLDLHPREGKYGHAAAFPLQAGLLESSGERQYAVSAMVCNFPKATKEAPSLLRHSDFVTFFHEFGHIMHGILGHTKYSRFAGTSTERDFVECPSQALENWCWEPSILARVSEHHQTKEPLPVEIIQKMVAAKKVNTGLTNLRQIFFGVFDQTVHSQAKVDSEVVYGDLRTRITKIKHTPGTNPTGNFGHLMGGYDASYYGYLWSEVFSADVFAVFKDYGVMDQQTGRRYREEILSKGGSEDAQNYLQRFLGREPNQKAFLKDLGIDE